MLEKQRYFFAFQLTPVAGLKLQIIEREAADADAEETKGWESDGGGHAADLAVFAFGEGELDPGGGHRLAETHGRITRWMRWLGIESRGEAGKGAEVLQIQAAALQKTESLLGDLSLDLGVVGAGMALAGIDEAICPAGLIAEQNEAFRIAIQSPNGIDMLWKAKLR